MCSLGVSRILAGVTSASFRRLFAFVPGTSSRRGSHVLGAPANANPGPVNLQIEAEAASRFLALLYQERL